MKTTLTITVIISIIVAFIAFVVYISTHAPEVPPVDPNLVHIGTPKIIVWNPTSISSNNVQVGVIKEIAVSPHTWVSVRVLADIENTGSYYWTPTQEDLGQVYIEIRCLDGQPCQALLPIGPFNVVQ